MLPDLVAVEEGATMTVRAGDVMTRKVVAVVRRPERAKAAALTPLGDDQHGGHRHAGSDRGHRSAGHAR